MTFSLYDVNMSRCKHSNEFAGMSFCCCFVNGIVVGLMWARWSFDFPSRVLLQHRYKMTGDCCFFKILRRSGDGKHLMCFRSENIWCVFRVKTFHVFSEWKHFMCFQSENILMCFQSENISCVFRLKTPYSNFSGLTCTWPPLNQWTLI